MLSYFFGDAKFNKFQYDNSIFLPRNQHEVSLRNQYGSQAAALAGRFDYSQMTILDISNHLIQKFELSSSQETAVAPILIACAFVRGSEFLRGRFEKG